MNNKNTKKLYKDFQKLYRQHKLSIQESCMPWGFECGDGWFDLIYDLSKKISKVDQDCEATQVKEKFGTLRFYVQSGSDKVYSLIDKAEKKSEKTCENCGKPGKLSTIGWYSVRCKKCTVTR